jgi:hypothetical protein
MPDGRFTLAALRDLYMQQSLMALSGHPERMKIGAAPGDVGHAWCR